MYIEEFREILEESIKIELLRYIPFVVLCSLPVIYALVSPRLKSRDKKKSKRLDTLDILAIIVILDFIVFRLSSQFSVYKDMVSENYVCVHAKYVREREHASTGPGNCTVVVFLEGEDIGMGLEMPKISGPIGVDNERFPVTTGYGMIWYTGNSHYILKFIPDES